MLKTLPPTYFKANLLALLLTGLISTPAIPSIIAKVTIANKFVPELVEGMATHRSKASAGLAYALCILGFVMAAPIFLTGSSTNLLLLDMMPAAEPKYDLARLVNGRQPFLLEYAYLKYQQCRSSHFVFLMPCTV